jgi:hypothetical protein
MRLWRALVLVGCALIAACHDAGKPVYPARRAGRGDPCQVLNDCKEPLLCIGGRCLDASLHVKATDKQCVAVECIDTADCCPPHSKPDQEACDARKKSCGSDSFCLDQWAEDCKCQHTCKDHWCVATKPTGSSCSTQFACVSGKCVDGTCVECKHDADCGDGYLCKSGSCAAGCRRDEQCGALERCDDARCVARGCLDDRECIEQLGARDARCQQGACIVPCADDAACVALGSLMICHDGACTSLGCERDSDCGGASEQISYPSTYPAGFELCLDAADAARVRAAQQD